MKVMPILLGWAILWASIEVMATAKLQVLTFVLYLFVAIIAFLISSWFVYKLSYSIVHRNNKSKSDDIKRGNQK